jgi:hypothetical protein
MELGGGPASGLSTLLQKSQEAIGILYDEFGDDISIKP